MEDSIFTKIIKGDIPGQIIYKDDTVAVLLTIEPLTEGHMLVVPLQQVDSLWDIDNTTYHHLWDVARQMAHRLQKIYPAYERIGTLVEGFGVPHAHIHVFGYEQPLNGTISQRIKEGPKNLTADELAAVAAKLRSE